MMENIKLEWEQVSCYDAQYESYFYNKKEDRTYRVFIDENSTYCPWSASLIYIKGRVEPDAFGDLPYEAKVVEVIPLAFAYIDIDGKVTVDDMFSMVVEDVVIYLRHRFEYLDFQTDVKSEYAEDDPELNQRRIELMKRYLRKHDRN